MKQFNYYMHCMYIRPYVHVRLFSLFVPVHCCYISYPSYLVQGHTAVTVGTDVIIFGGIVNGQRMDEVSVIHTRSLQSVTDLPHSHGYSVCWVFANYCRHYISISGTVKAFVLCGGEIILRK